MKCKVCGGTGTSNTCVNGTFKPCTFCDGTGEYEPFDLDVELDKLYPTKQTNEEWLKQCTTEQLAEWIAEQKCDGCNDEPYNEKHGTCKYCMAKKMEQVREWLKQPRE